MNSELEKGVAYNINYLGDRRTPLVFENAVYLGKTEDGGDYFMWYGHGAYLKVKGRTVSHMGRDYKVASIIK